MLAGLSANTHAVCRLRSPFLRCEAQECASTAVVRRQLNECLLSLSVPTSPCCSTIVLFNENAKSRAAAGGGYVHCLYFTCIVWKGGA